MLCSTSRDISHPQTKTDRNRDISHPQTKTKTDRNRDISHPQTKTDRHRHLPSSETETDRNRDISHHQRQRQRHILWSSERDRDISYHQKQRHILRSSFSSPHFKWSCHASSKSHTWLAIPSYLVQIQVKSLPLWILWTVSMSLIHHEQPDLDNRIVPNLIWPDPTYKHFTSSYYSILCYFSLNPCPMSSPVQSSPVQSYHARVHAHVLSIVLQRWPIPINNLLPQNLYY